MDDFEPFRRLVCSILEEEPRLNVIGKAADGLEAVQQSERWQPNLILLDIGLPKLNGIEAARLIRKVSPESRILFLSQTSEADVVQEALNLGAKGYILKSRVGNDLRAAVEAVLRGERFVSEGLKHNSVNSSEKKKILNASDTGRASRLSQLGKGALAGTRLTSTQRTHPSWLASSALSKLL